MPYGDDMKAAAQPIRIVEVGPRDGLQNEPRIVSTVDKVAFIQALSRTGVAEIECTSFVSPKAIPQLADADEVFRKVNRRPDVDYSALVANEHGFHRARAAGVERMAVFTAASDTFTKFNIHATVRESLARIGPLVDCAKRQGMHVRGYISTVVRCPYEGAIAPKTVGCVMDELWSLGVDEISLGETLGVATPKDIRRLLDRILAKCPVSRVAMHFHDTYGLAVANALTAWDEYGVTTFDSAAGGIGGCPYAPGAAGNVATEDLVHALKTSGASVAVDEYAVVDAARLIAGTLKRTLHSRLSHVHPLDRVMTGMV